MICDVIDQSRVDSSMRNNNAFIFSEQKFLRLKFGRLRGSGAKTRKAGKVLQTSKKSFVCQRVGDEPLKRPYPFKNV